MCFYGIPLIVSLSAYGSRLLVRSDQRSHYLQSANIANALYQKSIHREYYERRAPATAITIYHYLLFPRRMFAGRQMMLASLIAPRRRRRYHRRVYESTKWKRIASNGRILLVLKVACSLLIWKCCVWMCTQTTNCSIMFTFARWGIYYASSITNMKSKNPVDIVVFFCNTMLFILFTYRLFLIKSYYTFKYISNNLLFSISKKLQIL